MTIRPQASSGRAVRVLAPDTIITRGEAGVIHARSPHALGPYPATITERLDHWAAHAPDRHVPRGERRRWAVAAIDLPGGARTSPPGRSGARAARTLGRSPRVDSLRQQPRARRPGARVDVRRRAVRADCAVVFARVARSPPARHHLLGDGARSRVRRGRTEVCAGARKPSGPHRRDRHVPRRPARRSANAGRRSRARTRRPGHDCEDPLHLRLDRHPERRHQHAADAVRESGTDSQRDAVSRRRAARAVRLAAVESHLRRQPQLRTHALQRRHDVSGRGCADARGI